MVCHHQYRVIAGPRERRREGVGERRGLAGGGGGGKEREKKKTERFLKVADDTARDTAEW